MTKNDQATSGPARGVWWWVKFKWRVGVDEAQGEDDRVNWCWTRELHNREDECYLGERWVCVGDGEDGEWVRLEGITLPAHRVRVRGYCCIPPESLLAAVREGAASSG